MPGQSSITYRSSRQETAPPPNAAQAVRSTSSPAKSENAVLPDGSAISAARRIRRRAAHAITNPATPSAARKMSQASAATASAC